MTPIHFLVTLARSYQSILDYSPQVENCLYRIKKGLYLFLRHMVFFPTRFSKKKRVYTFLKCTLLESLRQKEMKHDRIHQDLVAATTRF